MSQFDIYKRQHQSVEILELNGELDAHTAPVLEQHITKLIESEKYQIVVNFSSLEYISSAGLGVFMAYIEDLRERGGDIKLTNMKENVYNVFDLLGFPTLYDILDEESQAIKRFQNPSESE
ncbi:MAG: STAS domain-containing protein [Balneolia bacterium]|nr:STAS domain-containing protein [Balneolia bacterium]